MIMKRSISGAMRAVFFVALASQVAACATIVEGTDQTVTVITDPAGSTCTLSREGGTVAVVNPTPGSVVLAKSSDNVAVLCTKDGHEDGAATLNSMFQGMTFGNILFGLIGGPIGVAIDAGSGAMHEYPSNVTVILPPTEFPTEADRDALYDRLIADVNRQAAEAAEQIMDRCKAGNESQCKKAVEAVEAERDLKIQEYEAKRARARIAGATG
jgi:hypothetical protein